MLKPDFPGRSLAVAALLALALPALLALLALSAPAAAAEQPARRIHVSGEGSVSMKPDMALLSLTVTRAGDTAGEALRASNEAMDKVLAAMRDSGIEDRDLRTSNFNIQPRYTHSRPVDGETPAPPRIAGYTVSNSLNVKVRDIGQVGELLDTAVKLGVNEGGQISMTNGDTSEAMEQARVEAMKNALAKAETLARAAGVRTGELIEVSEQTFFPGPPHPMFRASGMKADYDMAAVPVATGENTYRVQVNIAVAIEQ